MFAKQRLTESIPTLAAKVNDKCFLENNLFKFLKQMKTNLKQTKWSYSIFLVLAMLSSTLLSSCDEDNGLPYYDENSLDLPYIFSEGYQDQIQYPYELTV